MLVSNLEVSGSIKMHGGGITGSLLGTSSYTVSSSQAVSASYLIGQPETSSYAETASYAITASFLEFSTSSATVLNLTGSLTVTGTLDVSGSTSLTGSLEVSDYIYTSQLSASFVSASTVLATSFTGSFTGSFRGDFTGSGRFSGSFTGSVRGEFSGSGANLYDISASSVVGLNLSRISSGSVTASVSPVEGFVVDATKSTITGSLTVTGTVSGSFSGSGADLYDISASAIRGLSLVSIATGSVTASVDNNSGFTVTSLDSGSLIKGDVHIETGSLTAEFIYAGYPSGSGVSGSTPVSGTNIFGTASWATNVAGNKYIDTGSTNAIQAITGSLIITQNLTVQGSSSFTYVTASQILIDQNTLTVFTSGSSLPNGGYKVADTSSWDGTSSFTNESSLLYNTVDKYWTLANSLIVSGTLQVSQSITASGFDGTASLSRTASFVNPLTQSVIVTGSLQVEGNTTITGSITLAYPSGSVPTGSNIIGTSSWSVYAVSASWAPGAGNSDTASYAIEAATKRFVTESAYYAIHSGHVAYMKDVYNHGTYSINEGKGVYAVGTESLYDHGKLETEQFFNKGILVNAGDLQVLDLFGPSSTSGGGGGTSISASYALTASYVANIPSAINTGSFVTTGSQGVTQTVRGTLSVTGSLRVAGPVVAAGTTYNNTTTFNSAGNAIFIQQSVIASSSVGENTRKSMLFAYTPTVGLFVQNQAFNGTSSAYIGATFTQAGFGATSGSSNDPNRVYTEIFATTASMLVSGTLPFHATTRALFSGSNSTRSIQLENAVYLTGDRTGDIGSLRIQGVSNPFSGSIDLGPSGSNLSISVSESFSSFAGTTKSLRFEAPAFQYQQGFNTPIQVNPLGNIYMGVGNNGVGVNEGLAANQYAIQHTGYGANLMLKHGSAPSGQFFRIQNAFTSGLLNRLQIINAGGTGVYLESGSTSWTALSDERFKDILYPIENAVEKVEGLRTVVGRYKTDDPNERRAFFIAQDVVKEFPEAAEMSNPDELGVNYTELSPLMAAAIKELAKENRELRAELDEIKLILSRISQ